MCKLNTGFRFYVFQLLMLIVTSAFLYGCGTGGGYDRAPTMPKVSQNRPAAETPNDITSTSDATSEAALEDGIVGQTGTLPPVRVAILLPLSGKNASIGESMLRASEMALFDIGHSNFELVPKDTGGTAQGAVNAARAAVQEGAKLVIGPVFSDEVKAARQVTQSANINMIAFTTDWTLANRSTFLIGFLPFDQVERVVRYASAAGYKRMGVLSPSDSYGNAVVNAYQSVAEPAGISVSRVERLPALSTGIPVAVRAFADYDQRQSMNNAHGAPFDAVLMPLGGSLARQVSGMLRDNALPPTSVKRLGTGLMDDPALAQDPSLAGAWFAAPSPMARQKFETRYGNTYGIKPLRLASLAYDATALAAVLARNGLNSGGTPSFDHSAITNPNGFSGVDGIFRFRPDGISERGLAVLEYRNGEIVVIDKAPNTFQREAF